MVMKENGVGYSAALAGIRILVYALLVVMLIFCGRTAYRYGYVVFNEKPAAAEPGEDVELTVPEGASVKEIANLLKENGLIEDVTVFRIQERLSAYHGKLIGGDYILNTSQTPTEMMEILSGTNTEGQPERTEVKTEEEEPDPAREESVSEDEESEEEESEDETEEEEVAVDTRTDIREMDSETWTLLGASAAAMIAGLIFVRIYKRRSL